MPTQEYFDRFPPFPDDLPIIQLPRLSYDKLLDRDAAEMDMLYEACIDKGFCLLDLSKAPGGTELLRDVVKVFDIGREFFNQDLAVKEKFKLEPNNIGYKPIGFIKYPDGKSDLSEICAVGRDSIDKDSQSSIPRVFDEQRDFLVSLCNRLHPVAMEILYILAHFLKVSPGTFDAMHDRAKPSATLLRFIHNPPQSGAIEERYASLMGHTDNGSLTVLFSGMGGLQILPPDTEEAPGNWCWVRPEPNCAIINVGDAVVQWTGGIPRSNYHRVFHAPGKQGEHDRYSFGYFLKPADAASMRRFQQGSVIPRLSGTEEEEDRQMETYQAWHRNKSKGIMKGQNNIKSRGGLGAKRKSGAGSHTKLASAWS